MGAEMMQEALSTDLLMRLCRASPEQMADIEGILAGAESGQRRVQSEERRAERRPGERKWEIGKSGNRYLLRKGLRGWWLVFDGRQTVLPDEKGVGYVAVLLLDPPTEPMHASELARRAYGDAVV